MIKQLKQKIQKENFLIFFFASVVFFIPLSPTLRSVSIVLTAGLALLIPACRQRLYFILSQQCSIAAIIMLCVVLLACFWSVADYHLQYTMVKKYFKLLYIPLFAVCFTSKKNRAIGIHVFLLSSLLVCLLSLFKSWNIFHYKSLDPGEIFHNHIVTGYMMAFAAYLAGFYAIRSQKLKRAAYLLLALLFSYQVVFVNTGRTGCVVYLILLLLLFIQCMSSRRLFVGLSIYTLLLGTVIITVPSSLSTGLTHAVQNLYSYKHDDKNTSVGYRLQFHQYAKSLFLSSPLIGYGTGGFKAQFRTDNPIPAWGQKLNDPHSQYWFIATEFGLIGIFSLGYFFISLLLISFRLVEMKAILLGLLIPFFFGNMSDCFLTNTGIGYLFVIFSALCLGEFIELYEPRALLARDERATMYSLNENNLVV